MTVVTDQGQPVAGLTVAPSGTSGTFTAFSPNATSTYVVCVAADTDNVGSAATITVSWGSGGSGTWAQAMFYQENGFSPAHAVWWVTCPSSPGSSTITVTSNGHISGFRASVSELTNCAANPVGATATDITATDLAISLTPTTTGSLGFSVFCDRNQVVTVTGNGSTTILNGGANGGGGTFFTSVSSGNLTAGTPVSLGLASGTVTGSSQIAVEFLPSPLVTLTSTVGPAVATLTTHLQNVANANPSLNVGVFVGAVLATESNNNWLTIGDPETGVFLNNYDSQYASLPATAYRKTEDYEIEGTVRTWNGGSDPVTRINEAMTLLNGIRSELATDIGGSGVLTASGSWSLEKVDNTAAGPLGGAGWGCVFRYTVHVINVRIVGQ